MRIVERIGRLREERENIERDIAEAAIAGDAAEWTRLRMRKDALDVFVWRAEADPVHEEVSRLEGELEALDAERERVLSEPLPEVEPARRHVVTGQMLRRQELEGIARQSQAASKDLKAARAKLAEMEAGAP